MIYLLNTLIQGISLDVCNTTLILHRESVVFLYWCSYMTLVCTCPQVHFTIHTLCKCQSQQALMYCVRMIYSCCLISETRKISSKLLVDILNLLQPLFVLKGCFLVKTALFLTSSMSNKRFSGNQWQLLNYYPSSYYLAMINDRCILFWLSLFHVSIPVVLNEICFDMIPNLDSTLNWHCQFSPRKMKQPV